MRDIWQEIDNIRKDIDKLELELAQQHENIMNYPKLRCGDITETSFDGTTKLCKITERDVDAQTVFEFEEVYTMPNSPLPAGMHTVMFFIDDQGKRYILPQTQPLICVYDNGNGTGKRVDVDKNGTVTTPTDSETLTMVFAEPTSKFHDSTRPTESGRIYPAKYMVDSTGDNKYYLCFLAGHGPGSKLHSAVVAATGTVTFSLYTDYSGKVTSFSGI